MSAISIECLICGTALDFQPGQGSVGCPICEEPRPLPLRIPDGVPSILVGSGEPWQDALSERVVASCPGCSAKLSAPRSASRALDCCPHCRTTLTPDQASAPVMAAHGYLPFLLDANAAAAALHGELSRLSLAAGGDPLVPLYLPWLLVSCHVRAVYEGKVGYVVDDGYDPVTKHRRTRIEWTQAVGTVERPWDNQGGCASQAIPGELARRLMPWDFAFAEPITTEGLASIPTEHISFAPENVFAWAVPNFDGELRRAVEDDMRSEHRQVHAVHPQRQDERVRLVLVPVWLGRTSAGVRVAINARTGEVVVSGHAGLEPEEADVPLQPDRARYVRLGIVATAVAGLLAAIAWGMLG